MTTENITMRAWSGKVLIETKGTAYLTTEEAIALMERLDECIGNAIEQQELQKGGEA